MAGLIPNISKLNHPRLPNCSKLSRNKQCFVERSAMPYLTATSLRLLISLIVLASINIASAADIVIGQTIALTGGNAQHGSSVAKGVDTYLDTINAQGGIRKHKIRIVREDDGGDSKRATDNVNKLIDKDHAVAIFSGIEGGPCVASTIAATAKKLPIIACAAGSPELREPYNRYSFPVRAAHFSEFAKLIDIGLSYGYKRFAFIHSDSDTGRKHLINVKRLMGERQALLALAIMQTSKTTPEEVAALLQEQSIDVVFNHGSAGFYGKVVQAAQKLEVKTAFFAVNSGAQQMVKSLGDSGRGIIFTQVVPYPWGVAPAIVAQYQAAFRQKYPNEDFSFSSLEGYINAVVLVNALRSAKAFTPEAITVAMETLGNINIGGMEVNYGIGNHVGSKLVDTVVVSSTGKFVR
jgi:branched-chain amino acid transport system substrate-binding protein